MEGSVEKVAVDEFDLRETDGTLILWKGGIFARLGNGDDGSVFP